MADMSDNRAAFELALAAAWPPAAWEDFSLVAAVSGGADSVALLRALAALKTGGHGRLVVAHFNHRLRAESLEEVRFVADLAARLGIAVEMGEGDAAAIRAHPDGLEAGARVQRYAFLRETAERIGARYIVTAHTADDQAETIIHRIVRGTAVAGLAGIHRARQMGDAVTLIRPLLDVRRSEVLAYLAAIGQAFCDDASNQDPAYIRNRIRHELLPYLAAGYNPDVAAALVRLGTTARDVNQIVESLVAALSERAVTSAVPHRAVIRCDELAGQHRHLIRELFVSLWRRQGWPQQAMTFAHWDRLAELALNDPDAMANPTAVNTTKQSLPGAIIAERNGAQLELTRLG
jgi:tRNA(Ile)-lysidine synthase